jgi:hypothetical protein
MSNRQNDLVIIVITIPRETMKDPTIKSIVNGEKIHVKFISYQNSSESL